MTELKTARELAEVYVKRFHDMRDCSAEYQIKEMLILIEAMREACVEQIVSIPLGRAWQETHLDGSTHEMCAIERDKIDAAILAIKEGTSTIITDGHAYKALLARAPQPTASAEVKELQALREALTPSERTKAAYIGEFKFRVHAYNEDGEEKWWDENVPWTTIKEIMAAIKAEALSRKPEQGGEG